MAITWPGWTWLENAAENAGITFCAAFMATAAASGAHSLSTVPWLHALDVAGYAALLPLLAAITSLRVSNGTASFLPNVVAKPRDAGSE